MSIIQSLVNRLQGGQRVVIQPHNYPDHDAIASAYGLQVLLASCEIPSRIAYSGEIQRDSLRHLMASLNIEALPVELAATNLSDQVIVVDGCKGNRNVLDLDGEEVAVIDHHRVKHPEEVPLVDIRPNYGACASIIHEYYHEMGITIPREVATALLIGLSVDTALMTRSVSPADVATYSALYPLADTAFHASILRNNIQTQDLAFYRYALENARFFANVAYCHFAQGCAQNLLGIIGDFFLSVREVDFVVLSALNENRVHFSVRSERFDWDASTIIQDALEGIGGGGGHAAMAGGIVPDAAGFDVEEMHNRFLNALGMARA